MQEQKIGGIAPPYHANLESFKIPLEVCFAIRSLFRINFGTQISPSVNGLNTGIHV